MHSSSNSEHPPEPKVLNTSETVFPEYFSSGRMKLCHPRSPIFLFGMSTREKRGVVTLSDTTSISNFTPCGILSQAAGRIPIANASDDPGSTGTVYVIFEGGCAKITRLGTDSDLHHLCIDRHTFGTLNFCVRKMLSKIIRRFVFISWDNPMFYKITFTVCPLPFGNQGVILVHHRIRIATIDNSSAI